LPIDNNLTEQLMKQVALGRKNWMFIGSVDAGNRAADLMTLVSSDVRNDLDVFLYLKDVLDKLLGGSRDFEAMRPDVWKLAYPEAVRIYSQDERRHRAEVKSAKRAKRRAGCRQAASGGSSRALSLAQRWPQRDGGGGRSRSRQGRSSEPSAGWGGGRPQGL